jgi:hypothetical protein
MTFFFMAALSLANEEVHGVVLAIGGGTVGIVGAVEPAPTLPVMGDTLGVRTTCAALTPRLPI